MTLKQCAGCGIHVSDKASSCPHCGVAVLNKKKGNFLGLVDRTKITAAIFIFIFEAGVIYFGLNYIKQKNENTKVNEFLNGIGMRVLAKNDYACVSPENYKTWVAYLKNNTDTAAVQLEKQKELACRFLPSGSQVYIVQSTDPAKIRIMPELYHQNKPVELSTLLGKEPEESYTSLDSLKRL